MSDSNKEELKKAARLLGVACLAILFYFLVARFDNFSSAVHTVASIIRPFIIGAVIAYLLMPVSDWILNWLTKLLHTEKKEPAKADRQKNFCGALSIFLSIILFLLILFGLFAMVIPQTVSSLKSIVTLIPGFYAGIEQQLENFVSVNPELQANIEYYLNEIYSRANETLLAAADTAVNSVVSGISGGVVSTLSFLKDFMIGLIVAVYIMSSRKIFLRQARLLTLAVFPYKDGQDPNKEQTADWIFREANILNNYMNGFIKGKIIDSFIIGVLCFVFCLVVRMPYAELVSVIVGVTNVIPFFGPFIGAIPSALIILMVDPVKCLVFVVFIIILQQLDGNVIGPYILGNATKLSSFWVLFAILIFGGLFGIPGMILGVPVFGFIYQLVKEQTYKAIEKQKAKALQAAAVDENAAILKENLETADTAGNFGENS